MSQKIALEALLERQRTLHPFSAVREAVAEAHDRQMPNQILDLENLQVAEDNREAGLQVEVPNLGRLTVTEHAKAQLGNKVGVSWDKWFDPKHIKPEEIQRELQRRFSRSRESCLVRASRFAPHAEGVEGCDGYIRGFLSPGYTPIDNDRIFSQMESNFSGFLDDMKFMENHMGGTWDDDRSSHFSAVGQPICLGEINPEGDGAGGAIYEMARKEGMLPDADWAYLGFHIRNSEVGYTALTIDTMIYRLICLNGVINAEKDGRVLYRKHVKIDDPGVTKLLHEAFVKLEDGWAASQSQLKGLYAADIEDPEKDIRKFLRSAQAPKTFIEAAVEAWELEPVNTKAGVMHAISRAAQGADDMNRRYNLEGLAGRYLATA